MATIAEKERYPLATQEGNSIPLEVAEAVAFTSIAFTGVATSPLVFPEGAEIAVLYADFACLVAFGKVVPTIVDSVFATDVAMVPENCLVYLVIPPDKGSISVVRDGLVSGILKVQLYRTWRALKQTLGQI